MVGPQTISVLKRSICAFTVLTPYDPLLQLDIHIHKYNADMNIKLRFLNNLNASNSNDSWTESEEKILTEAVEAHSTQWRLIPQKLPGKCKNAIKNHWYGRERKRMLVDFAESEEPSER
ncbi:hypothetical protein V7S43_009950 [Phytophthora oleae]|uniref:Myb-like domain-containing protein n=1 Tax=Phytophthora oleae TaxID=2107226 RepID=A0ABD3FEQ0_9STRA